MSRKQVSVWCKAFQNGCADLTDELCTLRNERLWSGSGSRMPVILLQGWSVDCVDLMQMSLLHALMIQFPAGTDASVESVVLLKSSVLVHCMCVKKIPSKHYMPCLVGIFTLPCSIPYICRKLLQVVMAAHFGWVNFQGWNVFLCGGCQYECIGSPLNDVLSVLFHLCWDTNIGVMVGQMPKCPWWLHEVLMCTFS